MIYSFLFFTTFIIVNSIKTYRKALNVFQLALSNDASIPYVGNSNDVVSIPYVGNWNYNYRKYGWQSSTDDVFVALTAIYDDTTLSNILNDLKRNDNFTRNSYDITTTIGKYVDLGTGIGSILLIVANRLKPKESIGFEAQYDSVSILQKTLNELPLNAPKISTCHQDIRYIPNYFPHLLNSVALITGNPPYLRTTGRLPLDQQRREARFEMKGGIEEYCQIASKLLSPHGRFVCSFPSKDNNRIQNAASDSNLIITKKYDLLMGVSRSRDISIYNMIRKNDENCHEITVAEEIDIKRDKQTNSLSKLYMNIRSDILELKKRPLK